MEKYIPLGYKLYRIRIDAGLPLLEKPIITIESYDAYAPDYDPEAKTSIFVQIKVGKKKKSWGSVSVEHKLNKVTHYDSVEGWFTEEHKEDVMYEARNMMAQALTKQIRKLQSQFDALKTFDVLTVDIDEGEYCVQG